MNEITETRGCGGSRSRTSLGFHDVNVDAYSTSSNFDTRDLSLRPKSSYVRRHQLKKKMETDTDSANNVSDVFDRPQRLARPKSRLGRISVPKSEPKIALMENEVIEDIGVPYIDASIVTFVPHRENTIKNCANNVYDCFASTRQSRSKRTKQFCESNTDVLPKQTFETMNLDSSSVSMEMRDEINNNDVQIFSANADLVNNLCSPHVSCYDNNTVPRNTPIQIKQQQQQAVKQSQRRPQNSLIRQESTMSKQQPTTDHVRQSTRSNIVTSNVTIHAQKADKTQIHLHRNVSNVGRPKNPEPVSSRPMERPDMRPSTRSRRLQKRYIQQSQHSNPVCVRPTSESVVLARQKTEKNLFKKQSENRPYSEKILVTSNIISVGENPAQGPQTLVTSKGGFTQASHVQSSGFRGYDPTSLVKPVQSRFVPGDTTFPRQGNQNKLMSGSKPLTLMKLPPLKTSVVAKKNGRGLTLAQRETCA